MRCCAWVQAHLARGNAATRSRGVVSSVSAWRNPAAAAPGMTRHKRERERDAVRSVSCLQLPPGTTDHMATREDGRRWHAAGAERGPRASEPLVVTVRSRAGDWLWALGDLAMALLRVSWSSRLLVCSPPLARSSPPRRSLVHSPSDMAATALAAFRGRRLAYVGEGRGGANGDAALFSLLEVRPLRSPIPRTACVARGGPAPSRSPRGRNRRSLARRREDMIA